MCTTGICEEVFAPSHVRKIVKVVEKAQQMILCVRARGVFVSSKKQSSAFLIKGKN